MKNESVSKDAESIVLYGNNSGTIVPIKVDANGVVSTSGGTSIGATVGSGTPGSVLFVDASGNLGQDTGFTYNSTTNLLSAPGNILLDNAMGYQMKDSLGTARSLVTISAADNVTLAGRAGTTDIYIGAPTYLTVKSTGAVGRGTAAPGADLDIRGANKAFSQNHHGNLFIGTTDAQGINIGGSLALGGKYDAAGTTVLDFGRVNARKSNATDSNLDGYLSFDVSSNTSPYMFERMRIDKDGNVGIGTIAPLSVLHISKAQLRAVSYYDVLTLESHPTDGNEVTYGPRILFRENDTANGVAFNSASISSVPNYVAGPLYSGKLEFATKVSDASQSTAPTVKMTILESGNVGIGMTAPNELLEIYNGKVRVTQSSTGNYGRFYVTGGNVVIDATGAPSHIILTPGTASNVGIGTTAPDKKLEINHATGANLRLTYNDANGSAANYADFSTSSTGDLTIAPSGGDLNVTGTISASTSIILQENAPIILDPAGSADGKYSGTVVVGTGGATIAFGDLVTLDKDDSRWELVDISAAAAATGDARGIIGIAVTSSADGDPITVLLHGIIRADANFPALTIGAEVFASTTGDLTSTQPTTTDYVIRRVGAAVTADEIYFSPSYLWYTHT